MTGLEQVKAAVAATLNKAGVRAVLEYGPERAKCYDGAVISVGVRKSECRQAGLCDYLGEQEDPETGLSREFYGRRLELSLSLDAWADPETDVSACQEALEQAHEALLRAMPAGIRPGEMTWGEVQWDKDARMFLRQGTLQCSAYLTATVRDDTGLLTDFILKGVLTD